MRGKNILWISLIAMLVGVMMVNIVTAPVPPAKIYVDPPTTTDQPPGEFTIDINVDKVSDLYAYGVTVDFAPYVSVLVVSQVTEGPFLKAAGSTFFKAVIKPFAGTVKVGCTLLGAVPGASGEGTLFSIKFVIAEAGESQLDLLDTSLLNSNLMQINHNVGNGYYYGPTANLIRMQILPGRSLMVGQTATFTSKVKNHDYHKDLCVKVKFDMIRDDGKRVGVWAGQSFVSTPREPVYLYVNEYDEFWEWDWDHYGAEPHLDAIEDGSYIESSTMDAASGTYGFENLVLNPGDVIGKVVMEGYTQYPGGADDDMDMDMLVLLWAPFHFAWAGSLWGTADYGWHTPRWIGADLSQVMPELLGSDATNINNLLSFATYWTADGLSHGPMRLDALRLRVEFSQIDPVVAPIYCLGPQEELELDPAMWALASEDVGRYAVTATAFYTYMGFTWIAGTKVQTRNFQVSEP